MSDKLIELAIMGIMNTSIGDFEEAKKNYLEAINGYEKALKKSPDNIIMYTYLKNIYLCLATLYITDGNFEQGKFYNSQAINVCLKVLEIDPKDKLANICLGDTYSSLSTIYIKEKNFEQGKEFCLKAISNYKNILNKYLEILSNSESVSQDYLCLENTYSGLGHVCLKLGNIYMKEKNNKKGKNYYLKAVKNYKKIVDLNFKNYFAYNFLGNVYSILGNAYLKEKNLKKGKNYYLKAVKNYEKIINLTSEIKPTNNFLENICLDLNKTFFKLKDTYLTLGNAYRTLGIIDIRQSQKHYLKAINVYEKAISLTKNPKELLFYLGDTLIRYLNIEIGEHKTIKYLKRLNKINKKKKCKNYNEPVEKFIEKKCYILINNLKKIDSLNNEIKTYLKLGILNELEKEFKIKIEKLKNIPKNYKDTYYTYKTIDKRLISDLNEKRMWKGKPKYFNDPFDPYYKKFPTLISEDLNKIRISCFTESYNNLLMWSHYGDNHKGICFGYKHKDIPANDLTFFEKIIYEELKTRIYQDDTIKSLVEIKEELLTISEVYLRKHQNWEYEKEWRLINLNYKEDYYYNIKISEIYFGIDCSEEDKKLIMKLLTDKNGIEYYRMKQGNNLSLNKQKIKLNNNEEIEDITE